MKKKRHINQAITQLTREMEQEKNDNLKYVKEVQIDTLKWVLNETDKG